MTSVFLAAACWRNLGRFVGSSERPYQHTVLPSQAEMWRCLLGSLGAELGSGPPSFGDEPCLPGAVVGATKRKMHPCKDRCQSLQCRGGVRSGSGQAQCVPAWGLASCTRQGGCALLNLGSQRGVGARQQEGFVSASSQCNQADVGSLGFLSSAQIGASLSQQTQSVTVTVERHLYNARYCGCAGNGLL